MSVFEYVAAFVAIVMGLSVARVMTGVGAFILAKDRSWADWVVAGWCFALIVTQIGWWMLGWFTVGQLTTISYAIVLYWFSGTALLFLASYILVPGLAAHQSSPQASAEGVPQRAFFICLALHFLLPIFSALSRNSWIPSMWLVIFMVGLSGAGVFLRGNRGQLVLLLVWVVSMLILNFVSVPAVGENSGSVLERSQFPSLMD
jgi:hypothetical protein